MNNIFQEHPFKKSLLALLALVFTLSAFQQKEAPTLYIIGDSTVRNSRGEIGPSGDWGWGTFIHEYFDTTQLKVSNQAMAGRSTRTFIKEGRWDNVLSTLKPGDFVMMQFGHNEGSTPDTTRAGYRGVLKGTGDETKELVWPDGTEETVHTYGWYIRKFIADAKAKGATPIVVSMIPRNKWKDGKVERAGEDYGKWAKESAKKEGAYFIDLNKIVADKYDKMGPDVVKDFFPNDHTHTDEAGARLNAASVVEGIRQIKKLPLNKYIDKKKKEEPTLFLIGDSTVKNGQGDGAGGLWGWGNFLPAYFDTTKINIENRALGGTSSRTYRTKGLWEEVLADIKPGDYVIMQFGHNDDIAITDTLRARGTIKGVNDDSVEVYNPLTKKQEVVHSYGWYMKQFIKEAKAKGATPIVASSVPQNKWEDGKLVPTFEDYSSWAEEAAKQTNTYFINLNQIITEGYKEEGEDKVRSSFFNTKDRTHTIEEGAKYNAAAVVKGIKKIGSPLKTYLKSYKGEGQSAKR